METRNEHFSSFFVTLIWKFHSHVKKAWFTLPFVFIDHRLLLLSLSLSLSLSFFLSLSLSLPHFVYVSWRKIYKSINIKILLDIKEFSFTFFILSFLSFSKQINVLLSKRLSHLYFIWFVCLYKWLIKPDADEKKSMR